MIEYHAKARFSHRRNSNMWWIQSVYVRAEHRRMGLFKQLYNYVKQEAIAADAGNSPNCMVVSQSPV